MTNVSWVAGFAAALYGSAGLRADQIVTDGADIQRVRIVGLRDGYLQYRGADGVDGSCDLARVKRLLVQNSNELRDLNEAEEYLAKERPEEAIVRYQRALRLAQDFWPAVIRVRMLQASRATDELDRTVGFFLTAMELESVGPGTAARLLPDTLPTKRDGAVADSLERLSSAAKQTGDEDAREVLTLFRFALLDSIDAPEADMMAMAVGNAVLGEALASPPPHRVKLSALRRLQRQGKVGSVLVGADNAIADCPAEMLPEFLMLKADALLQAADTPAELKQAAATYMRLPIHFGTHPLTPGALQRAAEIHARLERPEKAAELLRECLALPNLVESERATITSELETLQSSTLP